MFKNGIILLKNMFNQMLLIVMECFDIFVVMNKRASSLERLMEKMCYHE